MLTIGDGIAVGCAILGAVLVVWKLTSRGSDTPGNSKYVLEKVFNANMRSMSTQLQLLNDIVAKGFDDLRKSIRDVHDRIDKILNRSGGGE